MIIPDANYSVPWQKRRSKYCQEMEVRWIRRRRLCSDFTLCFHFFSVLGFVFFLLLVAFGCCLIVTEHWVPNLHFSSRCKSRALVDSVIPLFFLAIIVVRTQTVSVPSVLVTVKSDHLLLLVLVVVHLCVLGQLPVTVETSARGWRSCGTSVLTPSCAGPCGCSHSVSRIFHVFSSFGVLLEAMVDDSGDDNSEGGNCGTNGDDDGKGDVADTVVGVAIPQTCDPHTFICVGLLENGVFDLLFD